VGAGLGDQRAAIGVADEHDRSGDVVEGEGDGGDVAFEGVQGVLRGVDRVPLGLERGDQLAETRTVGPDPMGEDDAGLSSHDVSS
jgi:hypothetical protein